MLGSYLKYKQSDYESYIPFTKQIAFWSFVFGTLLFGLFCLTKAMVFITLGIIYLSIVGLINFGVFLFLFFLIIDNYKSKKHLKPIFYSVLILLVNIPIVFTYYKIVLGIFFSEIAD